MRKFTKLGHSKSQIRSVGITNQRETVVVWDSHTGRPLYNAVVWPDTRTAALVRELRQRPGADELLDRCGLPLSTYPSSVKLLWLLQNEPAVRDAADAGRLAFGTVDSWLIYQLNGGATPEDGRPSIHVTDTTNASRTMFMNLKTCQYDDRLLAFFGIDRAKVQLPTIVPSSDATAYGIVAAGALAGIAIAGCLGDQSSALVGQCGFHPGQAKNTYGTGCFLLYNVGTEPVISRAGLLATVAYDLGHGQPPVYALEGSIAVAGAGVKFLTRNLGFAAESEEITDLATSVKDNGGVVFVTAFSGLFAPYWIDDAKGTLFGITQFTQKGHIARATLEATCYQTKAILDAMERDSGKRLESLAVDGGLFQQRPVHADPGRRHGHPRGPASHARDHGPGRRHCRRPGHGRLEQARGPAGRQPQRPPHLPAEPTPQALCTHGAQVGAGRRDEPGLGADRSRRELRGGGRRRRRRTSGSEPQAEEVVNIRQCNSSVVLFQEEKYSKYSESQPNPVCIPSLPLLSHMIRHPSPFIMPGVQGGV